jgi:hypothetical protein
MKPSTMIQTIIERTQKMEIQDVGSSFLMPLELEGFMIYFKQGDTPWNPSSFSDQVADKNYKYLKYYYF